MKRLWLFIPLVLLSGCVTTGGTTQYRGALNGAEYRSMNADGIIINVSGDAPLVTSPDGAWEITSKDNINDRLQAISVIP